MEGLDSLGRMKSKIQSWSTLLLGALLARTRTTDRFVVHATVGSFTGWATTVAHSDAIADERAEYDQPRCFSEFCSPGILLSRAGRRHWYRRIDCGLTGNRLKLEALWNPQKVLSFKYNCQKNKLESVRRADGSCKVSFNLINKGILMQDDQQGH